MEADIICKELEETRESLDEKDCTIEKQADALITKLQEKHANQKEK